MAHSSPHRSGVLVVLLAPLLCTCASLLDLCPPVDGRVGFFSRGDCVFTRGSFFAGHEWITYFGNESLGPEDRFNEAEIGAIVEGNRRTDFPLEMLVHLNTSVLAYTSAIIEYQDRLENQPVHFLLGPDNFSPEAIENARALMLAKTMEGVKLWPTERERALTLFGQVTHSLQDGYSPAHAIRRYDIEPRGCIEVLKAYVQRTPGAELDRKGRPVQFHGGQEEDNIGHTTTEDSIYREGRDCHTPRTAEEVEACLSDDAREAADGTADYLATVHELVRVRAEEADIRATMEAFFERRTTLCPG